MDQLVYKIGYAIATQEGFLTRGSRPQRNNNPGDLRDAGPVRIWPHIPIDAAGYLIIPDVGTGWDMLHRQIDLNIRRGLTLYEFFAGKKGVYAGYAASSDGNRPLHYAVFVATRLGGVPLDVPISQLIYKESS